MTGGDLTRSIAFNPDGSVLVYIADQDTDDVTELYHVSRLVPGDTIKLNSPLAAGGNVSSSRVEAGSDGKQFYYLADQDADEDFELYMVDIETPGASVKVNPVLPLNGDVVNFQLLP